MTDHLEKHFMTAGELLAHESKGKKEQRDEWQKRLPEGWMVKPWYCGIRIDNGQKESFTVCRSGEKGISFSHRKWGKEVTFYQKDNVAIGEKIEETITEILKRTK